MSTENLKITSKGTTENTQSRAKLEKFVSFIDPAIVLDHRYSKVVLPLLYYAFISMYSSPTSYNANDIITNLATQWRRRLDRDIDLDT